MFWNNAFYGNPYLEVWDDKPGGKIVDRFVQEGVEYVYVEFENSPGQKYLYLA